MPDAGDYDWDAIYRGGHPPWEIDRPDPELMRVLHAGLVPTGRAIELGCGTGANAVYLAQRRFEVTALDASEPAIELARRRARAAAVQIDFRTADVLNPPDLGAFEFIFDRGLYHILRRIDLPAYKRTLSRFSHPGTRYLVLAANAEEPSRDGPPAVFEHELRDELADLFEIDALRRFRFDTARGPQTLAALSALLIRRADPA